MEGKRTPLPISLLAFGWASGQNAAPSPEHVGAAARPQLGLGHGPTVNTLPMGRESAT